MHKADGTNQHVKHIIKKQAVILITFATDRTHVNTKKVKLALKKNTGMNSSVLNILVPTDFSESANSALEYASKLASESSSCITIFHAISIHVANSTEESEFITSIELEKIEKEQLVQLKMQISKRYPRVQYEIVSKMGFPVELIAEIAKEKKFDLIIMGTRGASGMKELLVGSNTASLIHETECPVLAVPEQTVYNGIKKIVFATNMQKEDVACISKISKLFKQQNESSITLLHIEDGHSRDPEALLQAWFHEEVLPKVSYSNLSAESISEADIVKTLHEYLIQNKVDLLVTATRKRNLIERIFDRSITKRLVFHTHIPLLAFHLHGSKGEIVL